MMKRTGLLGALALMIPLMSGCSPMEPQDFAQSAQKLSLDEYFLGETRAWGLFEDRFGKIRRQFVVDITGSRQGDALILDERFQYSDGEKSHRVWTITPNGPAMFKGTAGDVVGEAVGELAGNALRWRYRLDLPVGESVWTVSFDDWMLLQPGGVMLNRATVTRFGFEIGTVSIAFIRKDLLNEKGAAPVDYGLPDPIPPKPAGG
ncbi:DUF3833 domain-containing protein [Rhodospirillum rubrum]|uniref:Lipoprotein n=1 Tax=Rhodospirillum rubrum (strain ATCC 11170 / ATH 1.1.1 / DSM 467 / LMG 4362 / NCIMB 8255 / S1) TaxID=269796 RepID=Q2RWG4_RHORT|nr:DUF3833 domain-containing protein [Rhodospirillum rubrum]ABC21531.1 hypothetical protein Rru_A0727 [Rhodospirillum rubrum ATCC 11170]MBK5953153.1 hypothetical protein [Rhodospirillum rubrum]HAQ00373.1 DUF3833 domain-containing protein [Rhodospirillum rubrum]HCF16800.1 DUF3833 domain-containing protein [Rhodospirillum rubrum]